MRRLSARNSFDSLRNELKVGPKELKENVKKGERREKEVSNSKTRRKMALPPILGDPEDLTASS